MASGDGGLAEYSVPKHILYSNTSNAWDNVWNLSLRRKHNFKRLLTFYPYYIDLRMKASVSTDDNHWRSR